MYSNHHHHTNNTNSDASYSSHDYSSSSRYSSSARRADGMNLPTRTDKSFPGPLRIPPEPRFLASSPTSSSSSPYSSDNSPPSYRSTSPLPWTGKLPPIRHLAPSPRDNLPHLSSVRWDDPSSSLKSSPKYLEPSGYPSYRTYDDHKVAHQSYHPSSEITMPRCVRKKSANMIKRSAF